MSAIFSAFGIDWRLLVINTINFALVLAFEAQLREFLRGELGNDWFARREAGDLLRELWSVGQEPTADALLKDVTGATLEMAAVADRVREHL